MTIKDFFNYHVRNTAWCIRKGFSLRMMISCDIWFKEIPRSTKFSHPYGITIRKGVCLGEGCIFASNVTIGIRHNEKNCAVIGNNVFFGAGSIVLGPVTIGNNVKIAAGAIVLENIPDNTTFIKKIKT